MFEISLFSLVTLITFIDAYKSRIISLILKIIPQNPQIRSTTADIISLEKELSTISMVNEFAKYVKLKRRITKLKDDKKALGVQSKITCKSRRIIKGKKHLGACNPKSIELIIGNMDQKYLQSRNKHSE